MARIFRLAASAASKCASASSKRRQQRRRACRAQTRSSHTYDIPRASRCAPNKGRATDKGSPRVSPRRDRRKFRPARTSTAASSSRAAPDANSSLARLSNSVRASSSRPSWMRLSCSPQRANTINGFCAIKPRSCGSSSPSRPSSHMAIPCWTRNALSVSGRPLCWPATKPCCASDVRLVEPSVHQRAHPL